MAYGVPVVLAILAIAQQVASGTGTSFVQSVLEGISKAVPSAR